MYPMCKVLGSTVVVGALMHALLHHMKDLKAAQMNVQSCPNLGLTLYRFEPHHKAVEAIKNICCTKSECAVDHSTVTKWFKKFVWAARQIQWVALGEYQNLTLKSASSPLRPWQKYLELLSCARILQNLNST